MSVTALVTGGTGFLGRRLVSTLLQEDVRVRCLVRPTSDLETLRNSIPRERLSRLEFVQGDLSDRGAVENALSGMDVVYHLAAALGGSCSTMFLNTVVPSRTLMEAAAVNGVHRFVLVSSLGVYGTGTLRRWGTLDETTPVDPHPEQRDPYSFSKIRQESVAWKLREELGLPLVVVRPGVIYGPGRSVLTSRVGLSLGPLFVRMGGGQTLPYTYVDNCAAAICRAGLTPGIDGEIFNIVDENLPTGRKVLKSLRRYGKAVRSFWVPRGLISPLSAVYAWYSRWSEGQLPPVLSYYKSEAIWKPLRYSNLKARQKLNWTPKISTEEGLKRTILGETPAFSS